MAVKSAGDCECAVCGKNFYELHSVTRHAARSHGLTVPEYLIKYTLDGIAPVCACGCGEFVLWNKGKPRRFIHSHACRDPGVKQQMIDGGYRTSKDPNTGKKISDHLTRRWKEPEFRASQMKHLQASQVLRTANRQITIMLPENRLKASQRAIDFWASSESDELREYMAGDEFKASVSQGTKAGFTLESHEKMRRHATERIESGVAGPHNSKTCWVLCPFTNEFEYLHSSWELLFFQLTKQLNFPALRGHGIRIPYFKSDRSLSHYVPDFVNFNTQEVFEIKGQITDSDLVKKFAAETWCRATEFTYHFLTSISQVVGVFNAL